MALFQATGKTCNVFLVKISADALFRKKKQALKCQFVKVFSVHTGLGIFANYTKYFTVEPRTGDRSCKVFYRAF